MTYIRFAPHFKQSYIDHVAVDRHQSSAEIRVTEFAVAPHQCFYYHYRQIGADATFQGTPERTRQLGAREGPRHEAESLRTVD